MKRNRHIGHLDAHKKEEDLASQFGIIANQLPLLADQAVTIKTECDIETGVMINSINEKLLSKA